MKIKPTIFKDTHSGMLASCPKCGSNLDWTFEVRILGAKFMKWRHGRRKQCIHCGCEIDWSDYPCDVVDI